MVSATRGDEGSDSNVSSAESGGGGERGGGGGGDAGSDIDPGWVTATLDRLGSLVDESKTSEEKGGGREEKEISLDEEASEHKEWGGGAV